MAFSLLEAIAALAMLPSVAMLLQAGRPFEHFDYVQSVGKLEREPEKIHLRVLTQMEDIAVGLYNQNEQRGTFLRWSYRVWLISLLASTIVVIWIYI